MSHDLRFVADSEPNVVCSGFSFCLCFMNFLSNLHVNRSYATNRSVLCVLLDVGGRGRTGRSAWFWLGREFYCVHSLVLTQRLFGAPTS